MHFVMLKNWRISQLKISENDKYDKHQVTARQGLLPPAMLQQAPAQVKCPTLAALLGAKEQRKLLEKYGLDASLSDLKDVTDIWRNFEKLS